MRVWLDDIRRMPSGYDIWVRSYSQMISLINNINNKITHISFDHDLGGKKTGSDIAYEIKKRVYEGKMNKFTWDIHSMNPVGRENIEKTMLSIEKYFLTDNKK